MDYETFINQTFSEVLPPAPKKKKSADDITAEFAPIIEADRRKGGYGLRNVYKSNVFGSAAARTEKEKVSGRHNGGVCTDNRG